MTETVAGRCLGGEVRWETDGSPTSAGYSCRRNSAAPATAYFGVAHGHWRWTAAEPSRYASTPSVTRYFCATCGTPMAYESVGASGEIHLYAATMDDPATYRPAFHVHHAEHLPWLVIADDLPHHPAGSTEGDPE